MELKRLKANSVQVKRKISSGIICHLSQCGFASKDEIVNRQMQSAVFSPSEEKDRTPYSVWSYYRGLVGSAMSDLVDSGAIILKNGKYEINRDVPLFVAQTDMKEFVKTLLKNNGGKTKNEIFTEAIKHFGADKTQSLKDDNQIKSYIGDFINRLRSSGLVRFEGGKYYMSYTSKSVLDSYDSFISNINDGGGEFFENYAAKLLNKHFEVSGITVSQCTVTGGSNDGGVDVEIHTVDKLGFKDFVVVQAKARRNAQVSVKEIREFIGAMSTKGGTRGIFITTSFFHEEASALLAEVANVTGIDGVKLYSLAKEYHIK